MRTAAPTIEEIRAAREQLGSHVRQTPTWRWSDAVLDQLLGDATTEVHLKLECWQPAGSFKSRGALLNAWALDESARERGVTAVSAGNHAMAVAYAAAAVGTTAKVVMPKNANPFRVERCRGLGGDVVLVDDVHTAFEEVRRIERDEGRTFIHPFDGYTTALGTATVGLEMLAAVPDLDAVIVPIGGGGLCAGVSAAVKQLNPACAVYGVEPVGADSMRRSFASGKPESIDKVDTIADSLGAPHAAAYSFGLCRQFVDDLVQVDDDAICLAMLRLFEGVKLAVEPAAAAATAALLGPLRSRLAGARVGLIICGANIDSGTFATLLDRGRRVRGPDSSG